MPHFIKAAIEVAVAHSAVTVNGICPIIVYLLHINKYN